MTKLFRSVQLLAAISTILIASTPAAAQSSQATVSASIKKPLILTRTSHLTFGTILLSGSGTFSSTVSVAQNGTLTCPATHFTCSGTPTAAVYNASGNRGVVNITTDSTVTLTNANNETLTLTVNAPSTVTLTNSGSPGTNFGIGGSLTLTNNTPDGAYTGTINVTANQP